MSITSNTRGSEVPKKFCRSGTEIDIETVLYQRLCKVSKVYDMTQLLLNKEVS
jgi:hypothetical protein